MYPLHLHISLISLWKPWSDQINIFSVPLSVISATYQIPTSFLSVWFTKNKLEIIWATPFIGTLLNPLLWTFKILTLYLLLVACDIHNYWASYKPRRKYPRLCVCLPFPVHCVSCVRVLMLRGLCCYKGTAVKDCAWIRHIKVVMTHKTKNTQTRTQLKGVTTPFKNLLRF